MGRRERRAAKGPKEKVYTLTQSAIDAMIAAEIKKVREFLIKDMSITVSEHFMVYAYRVLRDKFGFGKTRLERFHSEVNNLADCVNLGYCTDADLVRVCLDEDHIQNILDKAYVKYILEEDEERARINPKTTG